MLDSVQLSLMIGPIIPLTPPRAVMDALAEVEVKVDDVGPAASKLTFSIDKQSPLQILFLLTGGIAAAVHARRHCGRRSTASTNVLIDGVITNNQHLARRQGLQLHPDDDRQGPDRADGPVEVERLSLPGLPAEARVALLLAEVRRSSASSRWSSPACC